LEIDNLESKVADSERIAKEIMKSNFGVNLEKDRLNIFGKYREFDLVNIEHTVVGDIKFLPVKASAQFSTCYEYI